MHRKTGYGQNGVRFCTHQAAEEFCPRLSPAFPAGVRVREAAAFIGVMLLCPFLRFRSISHVGHRVKAQKRAQMDQSTCIAAHQCRTYGIQRSNPPTFVMREAFWCSLTGSTFLRGRGGRVPGVGDRFLRMISGFRCTDGYFPHYRGVFPGMSAYWRWHVQSLRSNFRYMDSRQVRTLPFAPYFHCSPWT